MVSTTIIPKTTEIFVLGISGYKLLLSLALRNIARAAALALPIVAIGSQVQTASDSAAAVRKRAEASELETPVRQVADPGVITTNQTISPAGVQSVFESRVYGIAFGASSHNVYAATTSKRGALVYLLDWQSNKVVEKLTNANGNPGLEGLTYDPASQSVLMTAVGKGGAELVSHWNDTLQPGATILGKNEIAEVAVSPKDALIDAKNRTAYVSNWGGRFPRSGDLTATTGSKRAADKIVVDARRVAASGTISRID